MPRSKRRCAVSLHEVAKCTVPRRWSVSSWARAGGVKDVAAIAMADADKSLNANLDMGDLPGWGSTARTLSRNLPGRLRPGNSPPGYARSIELVRPICYSAALVKTLPERRS